jgi:WD40 repeat protein
VTVDNITIIEEEYNQNYLVYHNKNNELELFDLNNFKVKRRLECFSKEKILHIKHYQTIRKLIICSNNFIQVWNTNSFDSDLVIYDKELCLSCISIGLSEGTEFIFAGLLSGKHILVYKKDKLFKKIYLKQECTLIISDLLFKNDLFIISACSEALFINNFETGEIFNKYILDKGLVKCLITSEDNPSIIVIGTTDGFVQIFSIHCEKMLKSFYIGWFSSGLRWNREYVVFSCLGRLSIINIKLGLEVSDLVIQDYEENCIGTLTKFFHPDHNECLICVCYEKFIIWKN